eukprot:gene30807-37220_t
MEFTKCQISYNFIQPKLLDLSLSTESSNFSVTLPNFAANKSSPPSQMGQRKLITSQTSNIATPRVSRAERRRELGIDKIDVNASTRSSVTYSDSHPHLAYINGLMQESERRMSRKVSFKSQGSTQAETPSSGLSGLFPSVKDDPPITNTTTNHTHSTSPPKATTVTPPSSDKKPSLSQSPPALLFPPVASDVDATVMASKDDKKDLITDMFSPTHIDSVHSKAETTLSQLETLSYLEKGGVVGKYEVGGTISVTSSASSGSVHVNVKSASGVLSKCVGDCVRDGNTEGVYVCEATLGTHTNKEHKLCIYSTTYTPPLLKAKSLCAFNPSTNTCTVTTQLAFNSAFNFAMFDCVCSVALSSLISKLGGGEVEVGSYVGGKGEFHAAKNIVSVALGDVSFSVKKLTFSFEVKAAKSATSESTSAIAGSGLPLVVKGMLKGACVSDVSVEGKVADDAVEMKKSATMEWKFL